MMDEDKAFEKLDLPQTASEDEIVSRFRELSLFHHPDKGGNNDEMAELLVAKDIALSSIRNISLIPISSVANILNNKIEVIDKRMEQRESNERLIRKIINHKTNNLREMKKIVSLTGLFSGAFVFISGDFLPLFSEMAVNSLYIKYFFTIFAGISTLFYLISSMKVSSIEQTIEEINESLDDKSKCAELFDDVYKSQKKFLTKSEIERIIENLSPREVYTVGTSYYTSLILSKGLVKGIINEHETGAGRDLLIKYSYIFWDDGVE
ncbi:MAG: J domain-containing protein [Spirochaetes bacterium]|nr:J domain-containing protein [Spirochaetota bacterium]